MRTRKISRIPEDAVFFSHIPLFDGDIFTIEDMRFDYGETRYITFGLLQYRVIVVTHTEDDDVIRIISARKATKNEEKNYFEEVGH